MDSRSCLDIANLNGHTKFASEFHKFAERPPRSNTLRDISNTTELSHLTVVKETDQGILSPLNSLISLKSVPTSTPQDFLTIISDSTCEPDAATTTGEAAYYQSRQLSRNQSLLKIVSNSDHKTPQTISQTERGCGGGVGGGGKFLKRSESQIQSATLVELNNCIAQFEKFSYFSDESLKMEKDVKFSEISNKLVGFFYRIFTEFYAACY